MLLRRPRDTFAFVVAAAAAGAIMINGLYFQRGPHPAPIFAVKPLPIAASRSADNVTVPRPRPRKARAAARGGPAQGSDRRSAHTPLRAGGSAATSPCPACDPGAAASAGAAVAPSAGGPARAQRFRLRPAQAHGHLRSGDAPRDPAFRTRPQASDHG